MVYAICKLLGSDVSAIVTQEWVRYQEARSLLSSEALHSRISNAMHANAARSRGCVLGRAGAAPRRASGRAARALGETRPMLQSPYPAPVGSPRLPKPRERRAAGCHRAARAPARTGYMWGRAAGARAAAARRWAPGPQ